MSDVKIDLSKVKTEDYLTWAMETQDTRLLLRILEAAVVGGVGHRPITDLPPILVRFMEELNNFNTEVGLAIGSMKLHLLDNESES